MKTSEPSNRPTRSVVRWLEEDTTAAAFWRAEAFSVCAELGMLGCHDPDRRDRAGQLLADRLRVETKEASPLRGFDPYAEFVATAIDQVDWLGVADSLIGYVCREIAAEYRANIQGGSDEEAQPSRSSATKAVKNALD